MADLTVAGSRRAALPPGAADPAVARGFDRLSPVYDVLVALFAARAIPRSQTRFLAGLGDWSRALVVGGGSGGFLTELLGVGDGHVLYLDASRGMLERTRRRLVRRRPRDVGRVELRRGGLEALAADERFDLLCTHYFLDLFPDEQLAVVMEVLSRRLRYGGRWACADFAPPASRGPRRGLQTALLASLYGFFRVTCSIPARRLPPIRRRFAELGFQAEREATPAAGVLWTAVYRRAEPFRRGPAMLP
jgi:ubiquinone/menaquinone biosynthesis C-methylase UbiE